MTLNLVHAYLKIDINYLKSELLVVQMQATYQSEVKRPSVHYIRLNPL